MPILLPVMSGDSMESWEVCLNERFSVMPCLSNVSSKNKGIDVVTFSTKQCLSPRSISHAIRNRCSNKEANEEKVTFWKFLLILFRVT